MPSWYCSISCASTETISSALNFMTASRDDLVSYQFQLRPCRAVVFPVAGAEHEAAQNLRVDRQHQERFHLNGVAHLLDQVLNLVLGQGSGRRHFDFNAV